MELIQITQRELSPGQTAETVNARELWFFVESRQDFSDWMKNRVEKFGFIEGEDYLSHKDMENVTGGRPRLEYFLSIDMAKQLAMIENNPKGQEVRRYFIECERLAKAKAAVPSEADLLKTLNNPASLRTLLLQNVEKVLELQATVAQQAPKVAALDRIATASEGSLCITDAAKALQQKPKDLFAWLQIHEWIYRRSGTGYIAYQPRIKQGYLEHKITTVHRKDEADKIVEQVRVTAKGLSYLADAFSQPVMQLS